RVAEFSGLDAAEIEADDKLRAAGGGDTREQQSAEAAPPPARADKRARPSVPAGGESAATADVLSPASLAARRIEAAHHAKIDRSRYEIVRTLERLNAWIARAREVGTVAIDTETTSLDPMQAGLCGLSLALAPNEACYVPLAHRQGGDKGSLFPGEIAPGQIDEAAALAALKPLLDHPGVLKIGQNLKFDVQI